MTTKRPFAAFLLLAVMVLMGQGCGNSAAQQAASQRVTLKVWGVFDPQDAFTPGMTAYQKLHPNVSFEYRQLRASEYEAELVRAFAEGTGPDVFAVHNGAMGEFKSLMAPLPATLTIPYTEVKGTIKKEEITTLRTERTITPREVRRDFLDVVAADALLPYQPTPNAPTEERVWGLPASVDTMALYVNRDLLNAAGIAQAPSTWTQFQEAVVKLTLIGPNDSIIQSGAAMGTGKNVERATDLLALLMMQNGTQMTDERGRPTFGTYQTEDRTRPGVDATAFYTDFASPLKEVYTWNAQQPTSFDAFVTGKTAFFFGYSYHLPAIRARAPKLNVEIAPMPQIGTGKAVNYANYWLQAVAKAGKNQTWAWDFVQFLTNAQQAPAYLAAAKRPTARRALIASQVEIEDLSIFVGQLLTASSWYRGRDEAAMEAAMMQLIDDVNAGAVIEEAVVQAQQKITQTL